MAPCAAASACADVDAALTRSAVRHLPSPDTPPIAPLLLLPLVRLLPRLSHRPTPAPTGSLPNRSAFRAVSLPRPRVPDTPALRRSATAPDLPSGTAVSTCPARSGSLRIALWSTPADSGTRAPARLLLYRSRREPLPAPDSHVYPKRTLACC